MKRLLYWLPPVLVACILWAGSGAAPARAQGADLVRSGRNLAWSTYLRWMNAQVAIPGAGEGAPPEAVTVGETEGEGRMVELINAARVKEGLSPLTLDSRLVQTARAKSLDMITHGYFDHHSPTLGSPFAQMGAAGITYSMAAENLAGANTVEAAHRMLMESPTHRANVMNPKLTHIGVGVVKGGPYGLMVTQHYIAE